MLTAENEKKHLMPVILLIINVSNLTPYLLMESKWKRVDNATNVMSFSRESNRSMTTLARCLEICIKCMRRQV